MSAAAPNASKRSKNIASQLCSGPRRGFNADDDVVIISAKRTPLCKAKRGGFKDVGPTEILTPALREVTKDIDRKIVGDIVVGTVLAPGSSRAVECRVAAFLAGFPETVPCRTVNRQCSSGLQAIADVAACIRAGLYNVGVAAGFESMTIDPFEWSGGRITNEVKQHSKARDCLIPMGMTSDNVAQEFGVTRKTQDAFALESHTRALKAIKTGRFRDETVEVEVTWKNPKTGVPERKVIRDDDGPRPNISAAALAKLKPVFRKDGTTTAGNASQLTDGAAAVLMMTRRKAKELGLPILGVFRSFSVAGVPPHIMGIGPAFAIPLAVDQAGLEMKDIDLYEINEAFASQATYCVDKLGISYDIVNVNGGAIAIGHPLGCTGARMTATLLHEMKKRGCRYGVVSMCIGTGMGAAAVFEVEK